MSDTELLVKSEPVRRVEVFTGAGRRRAWTAAQKLRIVAESYGAGETVSAVARRLGSVIILDSAKQFGRSVALDYAPQGLRYDLQFHLIAIGASKKHEGSATVVHSRLQTDR